MSVATSSRPDLAAHRQAILKPFPEIVGELVNILGRKLTAYIGGVKDARAIDRWLEGGEAYNNAEARMRFTYQVARTLCEFDDPRVVQAWFIGLNPELDDCAPIRYLRENEFETAAPRVLGAARAFLAGG